jgi:Cu/Ag efflux pump CusA
VPSREPQKPQVKSERLRPKMMTVFAMMAGLLPIMWSHGTGAEVMQRIAVPNDRRRCQPPC